MFQGWRRTLILVSLLFPATLLLTIMAAGIGTLLIESVTVQHGSGYSLERYVEVVTSPYYVVVLLRSLKLAAITTVGCLFLGFPLAYYMETASAQARKLVVGFLVMLFFTEYVMRVYALVLVVGSRSLINQTLLYAGFIDQPLQIMYTEVGVCFGLITGNIAFMVFAINSVLSRIDPDLRSAASLLGAGDWHTLFRITVPLAMPGIVAGSTIVFLLSMSAYLTPALLGGGRVKMIANVVYDKAVSMFDVPMASAVAMLLLVISLGIILLVNLVFAPSNRRLGGAR
jgi:putative spermidine/putrescine transport system permease protein